MQCIIEGCQNEGKHNFGVRLRRPNTRAIWAPNTDAFVCDFHASRGMRVTVWYWNRLTMGSSKPSFGRLASQYLGLRESLKSLLIESKGKSFGLASIVFHRRNPNDFAVIRSVFSKRATELD